MSKVCLSPLMKMKRGKAGVASACDKQREVTVKSGMLTCFTGMMLFAVLTCTSVNKAWEGRLWSY